MKVVPNYDFLNHPPLDVLFVPRGNAAGISWLVIGAERDIVYSGVAPAFDMFIENCLKK